MERSGEKSEFWFCEGVDNEGAERLEWGARDRGGKREQEINMKQDRKAELT